MNNANECMICGDIMDDNNSYSLNCGPVNNKHRFHIICLTEALKPQSSNYYYSIQKQCPYCRFKFNGYIPCPEGIKPIKGLHKEYMNQSVLKTYNKVQKKKLIQCSGVYKTGSNKGKQCTTKCSVNYNFNEIENKVYCGKHKPVNVNKNMSDKTVLNKKQDKTLIQIYSP